MASFCANFKIISLVYLQDEELFATLEKPKSPAVPEGEKPQPMPMCYYNLLAGRAQRAAGTLSSSPEQAPAAGKKLFPNNCFFVVQIFS